MNEIINKMSYHQTLLNKTMALTQSMIELAKNANVEKVSRLADEREKLLSIISQVQGDVERYLNENSTKLDRYLAQKANSWIGQTTIYIQQIAEQDQILLEQLNQVKENTREEIGTVYKQKSSIKGYNLNNVKR
jgi:hypothetical protein